MEIKRLEPFFEKLLKLEAKGSGCSQVMVVIPTIVRLGKPFSATIALLDANAMPVFDGTAAFSVSVGLFSAKIPAFGRGEAAVCKLCGLVLNSVGFIRLEAVYAGALFFSNPAWVTDTDVPDILWGDPHIHTTVGDCHPDLGRTRNLAYTAARYVYGLDFIAISDHISWAPRGTVGKWRDNLASCDLYDAPGEFSALYCYEASLEGGRGGDNNIYMRQPNKMYVDPWPESLHIGQLCEKIDGDFFVVPHHTTRAGKHGEIPAEIYPGRESMPLVEIHSKWGCSEYRGNPAALKTIHGGPAYVQDLLAQGYRLGFIGGSDSHTSLTFCRLLENNHLDRLPGLTAVRVRNNTRAEIYDALKQQQCYAACGERIFMDMEVVTNDDGSRTVSARAAAQSCIQRMEVVCNGETAFSTAIGHWHGELAWNDQRPIGAIALPNPATGEVFSYYYVRVITESGGRAWSSPVWLC